MFRLYSSVRADASPKKKMERIAIWRNIAEWLCSISSLLFTGCWVMSVLQIDQAKVVLMERLQAKRTNPK